MVVGAALGVGTFSSKERKNKMKKLLFQLKQQLIQMVTDETTDMPTKNQVKLLKSFLLKYLKQHEIVQVEHENYCNLYQCIIESQESIINELERYTVPEILAIVMFRISPNSLIDSYHIEDSKYKSSPSKLLPLHSSNQFSVFNSKKTSLSQLKDKKTLQQIFDSYKQEMGSNYEVWQKNTQKQKV